MSDLMEFAMSEMSDSVEFLKTLPPGLNAFLTIIVFVVGLTTFIVHWRIGKKENSNRKCDERKD